MTEKMTDNEAKDVATRLIAAGVEDDFKIQYWLSLILATAAVVTAPIVTLYSGFYHLVRYPDSSSLGEFGVAMMYAWAPVAITVFVHWRVRAVGKRAGMKMRF
jgi:hypothetical protein